MSEAAVAPAEAEELPAEGAAPAEEAPAEGAAPAEGQPAEGAGEKAEGGTLLTGDQTGEAETPDAYADFVMPEGVEPDAAMIEQATPIFKELGLTQDQAQKLVDFQAAQVEAGSAEQADAFGQMMTQWQTDSKNDNEFGGDKFDENVAIAQAAVTKFGTPELKQLLTDHGVGNHPEMIRFMYRVGKLTQEDVPGGGNAPGGSPADRVSILYPNAKTA